MKGDDDIAKVSRALIYPVRVSSRWSDQKLRTTVRRASSLFEESGNRCQQMIEDVDVRGYYEGGIAKTILLR